jgi:signal transduction histidine kinase
MKLDLKPLGLESLVDENLERLRVKAQQKGIALSAIFDQRIPPVLLGDRVKLSQIFGNLIGNAIKFTSQGSVELVVALEALVDAEARVGVAIWDTGIGIDPEHGADIFEEYARQPNSADIEGWGLGLSISKKLVALHGGTITANRREGGGSVFRFSLHLPVP